ncbi:MAG: glycosyltransferase family 2 protein [Nanoarchaeota archaeon]|nr:glycosyltransferase family 2 protein [Nanoarchaeota archaeon]
MKVSIIIPTHGRPKVLEECLKSIELLKNELPKNYEIIVVNNNSKDLLKKTSKVCKEFKLNIKELKSKPVGSVKARNLGIENSEGEVLIFFDDDTIIQKEYFNKLLKHYKNKTIGAVGGSEDKGSPGILHKFFFLCKKPGSISDSGEIISNFSPNHKRWFYVQHLHGSNFSIKAKVINEIGIMDEVMEGHYRDETEFTYRVYKAGYKIVFEPKARVIHTATSIGGNVSPDKKKEWAYWYHRNTSYLFYKHLFNNNLLREARYWTRELITSLIRAIIYLNPYYITEIRTIKEGKKLALK